MKMKTIGVTQEMVDTLKANVVEQLQQDWKSYQAICSARQELMSTMHNAPALPASINTKLVQAISECDALGGELETKWQHFNIELSEYLDYSPF